MPNPLTHSSKLTTKKTGMLKNQTVSWMINQLYHRTRLSERFRINPQLKCLQTHRLLQSEKRLEVSETEMKKLLIRYEQLQQQIQVQVQQI